MSTQHVPAWKRLGLKLKFASENANHNNVTGSYESSADDTISPANDAVKAPPKKRKRPETNETTTIQPPNQDIQPNALVASTANTKVKKSVSFTADTKTSDGDSSRTLIEAYDDKHRLEDEAFQMYSDSISSNAANEMKPYKADKSTAKQQSSAPGQKSKGALEYLAQFQNQRVAWKFNKNHDVWLLKHALSTKHVPIEYEDALMEYVEGLRAERAKLRLRAQCEEVLGLRQEDAIHHERRDQIDGTPKHGLKPEDRPTETTTTSPASTADVSRTRASRLLQHISRGTELPDRSNRAHHSSDPTNGAAGLSTRAEPQEISVSIPAKRRKKKKVRTMAVEDSESTSSSSSSGDETE